MKSKTNQIILLIAVVIIWGLVIYRFIALPSGSDETIEPIRIAIPAASVKTEAAYEYALNYPDPFLTSTYREPTVKKEVTAKKNKTVKPRAVKLLPPIELVGFVTSNRSRVALIKIQSETLLVREGEAVKDFLLQKISGEQIQVRYLPMDTSYVVIQTKNEFK